MEIKTTEQIMDDNRFKKKWVAVDDIIEVLDNTNPEDVTLNLRKSLSPSTPADKPQNNFKKDCDDCPIPNLCADKSIDMDTKCGKRRSSPS